MHDRRRRGLAWILAVVLLVSSGVAILPATAADPGEKERVEQARRLVKAGSYDEAIAILTTAIRDGNMETEVLREAYLLLASTFIYKYNQYRNSFETRAIAGESYQEADRVVRECLGRWELRHTRPDTLGAYPPEIPKLFAQVRRAEFGTLRIAALDPPDAVVVLRGDTLRVGDTVTDVPAGIDTLLVIHPKWSDRGIVPIQPNETSDFRYAFTKHRSSKWYVIPGVLAGTAGIIAAIVLPGDEKTKPEATTLPPPPDHP